MKRIKLDAEEVTIEKNAEKYKPVSAERLQQIEKIIEGSRKSRTVNLRIKEADLLRIKEKAVATGLPYQTMIGVVLHKFVTGSFLDRHEIDNFLKLRKKHAAF